MIWGLEILEWHHIIQCFKNHHSQTWYQGLKPEINFFPKECRKDALSKSSGSWVFSHLFRKYNKENNQKVVIRQKEHDEAELSITFLFLHTNGFNRFEHPDLFEPVNKLRLNKKNIKLWTCMSALLIVGVSTATILFNSIDI